MSESLTFLSHHNVLVLLIQIAVLLLASRAFAEIAQRFNQPSVLGEILAGIILGPSLLGGFVPLVGAWLIPHTPTQFYLLEVVSLLGAMFLLLITGLETDLPLIRRHTQNALGTAAGGLILPFMCGFVLALALPNDLLVDSKQRLVFSLFLATAMSVSAIPVIAKVLIDLNLIRRDFGQITLAAGMVDDTVAWILLSIVVGLASGQAVTIASVTFATVKVLAFMAISFTVGRWLIKKLLYFTQTEIVSRDKVLSLVIILMFSWAAISQALNLEAVLGAFVVGILFSQLPNISGHVLHRLESMTFGIFAPIFFAAAGLKVNILNLMEPRLFGIAVIMILVAIFSKVVGAYAGARLVGNSSHWTALSLGFGLNARGAIQIIVANIGLSLGILTQDTFSMIILMAMVTSLITPFTVRWALRHVQPEAQELERLRYEALVKDNFIAKIHRVLLPVRRREQNNNRAIQIIEAQILEKLSLKTELAITLLSVASQNDKMESIEFLNQTAEGFSQPNLTKKVVESQKPIEVILTEAQKDYDLLIMGSSETNRRGILFTPLVDDLVRLSPCPSIVVKGPRELTADWLPKRILVPSNGSMASKRAGEVAFALAGDTDEEVHILQVIERRKNDLLLEADEDVYQRRVTIARQIVDELGAVGESLGVKTKPVVEFGPDPETVILNQAQENNVDLIVIGTGVRPGSSDLYLGPRVEYILNNAPCPVIVVNSG